MKKVILLMLTLCLGLTACRSGNAKTNESQTAQKDGVEVLYFHGKQRCATCMAIEQEAKAVVSGQFADAVKGGKLIFRVIDITKAENEAIADKYEITWSSLVVVQHKDGKEQAENLTKFAFANARSKPDVFRSELAKKINGWLK